VAHNRSEPIADSASQMIWLKAMCARLQSLDLLRLRNRRKTENRASINYSRDIQCLVNHDCSEIS
jgi:hypothetical protein